jgi:hypothetical protein
VFCACEITQLLPLVFCVVRALHKFDFRLVVNKKELRHGLIGYQVFVLQWSRVLRGCTQFVQVSCILLTKGHYVFIVMGTKRLTEEVHLLVHSCSSGLWLKSNVCVCGPSVLRTSVIVEAIFTLFL